MDAERTAGELGPAGQPVFWRPAATPLTVSEQALQAPALVVLGVGVAEGGQGAELQVGQGVHVGVAERDGAGQHVPVGQQAVVAGHGEHEAAGAVVLGEDELGQVVAAARAR